MRTASLGRKTLLAAALLQTLTLPGPARADTYDDLLVKWRAQSSARPAPAPATFSEPVPGTDTASGHWKTMDRSPGRTALWANLPFGTVSANITASADRLRVMAGAYNSTSSPFYRNAVYLQAIMEAMDWLVAKAYVATGTEYNNWWDWQIGTPTAMNSFMISLYEQLSPERLAAYFASIDRYVPNPAFHTAPNGTLTHRETGANALDKALLVALRGMLGKNEAKLVAARDTVPPTLQDVSTGDGFYADGSFIQHYWIPYVGSYGAVMLVSLNSVLYLLNNTPWTLANDPNYLKPFDWAMNSYRPFIYDGAIMDNQGGRKITRQFETDHLIGRRTVVQLAKLSQFLPEDKARQLKAVVKGWAERDRTFGDSYLGPAVTSLTGSTSSVSGAEATLMKSIINDPTIEAAPEPLETRYFPATDRLVSRGDGFAFALSMFSKRISAFESGNGENLRGWWTGMGMTYLYNADQTQYNNHYWATVDMWRLPGTTTDHSGSGTPGSFKAYFNSRNGVGGAELHRKFATAAMEFGTSAVTGTTLTGKKAWFTFGNRIVAVGAGITSTSGIHVETIVDNRAINSVGDNALTVNEVSGAKPPNLGWSQTMPQTKWAHLAGNTSSGSAIGYVFPDHPTLKALRETRTGRWRDVALNGGTAQVSNNYLSLAFDHGTSPANASYTYIMLPNASAQQTADFAAANPISVLERSAEATAVRDTGHGVTGIVFWNDAVKTVQAGGQPFMTSNKKTVVTLQQVGNEVALAVADPTQLNTGTIELELHRAGAVVISNDPAITVTQLSPTIKLTVNISGAAGKAFKATLGLPGDAAL